MSATATKRKPPTPKALQPKKLTLRGAADQWLETTLAIEGLKELQKEAAKRLLDHAAQSGKRTFFDQIAVKSTGGNLVVDTEAVRGALPAERFVEGDLMKRQKSGRTLERLK
jgi:hypothetical protein